MKLITIDDFHFIISIKIMQCINCWTVVWSADTNWIRAPSRLLRINFYFRVGLLLHLCQYIILPRRWLTGCFSYTLRPSDDDSFAQRRLPPGVEGEVIR